jgi:hypothetical protein
MFFLSSTVTFTSDPLPQMTSPTPANGLGTRFVPVSFPTRVFLPSYRRCSTSPVTLHPFVHSAAVRGALGATLPSLADSGGSPPTAELAFP